MFTKPKPLTPGPDDWIVTGEEVHENETIILTGNLIVQSGGNLTLINCTLLMDCSYDGQYQIKVESGGIMNVLEGSNITAYDPEHEFLFYVYGQLTMRNSFLSECGYIWDYSGLRLQTDEGVLIENCTISKCYIGICCYNALNVTIANCTISQNDLFGISCWNSSSNITITNCTISQNHENGINCWYHSSDIAIMNCVISQNGLGINCTECLENITITNCTISYNGWCGVQCWSSSAIAIHYCDIFSNDEHGLYVEGTYVVDATYCWWGSSNGPEYKEEGDPYDPEEVYSENGPEYVLYEPWLTEPWTGDVEPPTVEIIEPEDGSYVHGLITIKANASDNVAVDRVEFYINGSLVYTDYNTPYEYEWNTTGWADGTYVINATAYDTSNNTNYDTIIITVDNTPPQGQILAPVDNSYVHGIVQVNVIGEDANLHEIRLYIDGALVATWTESGTHTYEWSTAEWPNDIYELELEVEDLAGNLLTDTVWVIVDNAVPEGSINWPTSGSYVRGIIIINITGGDKNIYQIRLYVNDTLLATWEANGTYTYGWDTTGWADGTYMIRLEVEDLAGNLQVVEIIITVDNTPPEGQVLGPEEGSYVRGIVLVQVSATDNMGVDRVEFYINGTLIYTDCEEPYECEWNTTGWADGTYVINATIYDVSNNTSYDTVLVVVDNVPPEVSVLAPPDGSYVYDVALIQVSVVDNVPIDRVEFYINGSLVFTDYDAPYEYEWHVLALPDGPYNITVIAYNEAGLEGGTSITLVVASTIYVFPTSGENGTLVSVFGQYFVPNSIVTVYVNETSVVMCLVRDDGTFETDFYMQGPPGHYIINATGAGAWATATFDLYDYTPLGIDIDVGSVHFRGEIAEFYVLVTHHGRPVNTTSLNATLYWPNGTTQALTYEQITTGLYKITFNIPADAPTGTYTLFVIAHLSTSHVDAWGSAIRSFLLSPTLTEWNAKLIAIENDTAIIKTDVGVIKMNLTEIKAEIEGIQSDLVMVKSDVGTILARLEALNATLMEVRDDVLEIQTALGELEVKIDEINATVMDILDYCILINTTLGQLRARLEAINATLTDLIVDVEGNIIAEIQTALGEVEARLDELNATLTDLIINSKGELMALINTKAGEVLAKLEAVNATIINTISDEMGDYYALLDTTLGEIEVKLDTIKEWLTQMNATLVEIREDVVIIRVGSDTILARLDAVNATLTDIIITSKDEIMALIDTRLGELMARLEAINATLIDIQGDIAILDTTLGQVKAELDALVEDVDTILSILREWTGGAASVAGYRIVALTKMELRDIRAEGTTIMIYLHAAGDGRLHVLIPKDLLAKLGVSLDAVDVVLDWLETDYDVVDLGSCYMLVVSCGPGDHTVKIYLTGAPIYEKPEGLIAIGSGATIATVGVAWLIRRRLHR